MAPLVHLGAALNTDVASTVSTGIAASFQARGSPVGVENIMTRSKRLPVYVAAGAGVSALVVATRGTDLGQTLPLSYFSGDSKPGQTGGQGLSEFGGRWYVLSPAGTAVLKAPDSSKQGGSTGTYGY
jgi:hypothetical protein